MEASLRVSVFIWGLGGGAFTNLGTTLARALSNSSLEVDVLVLKEPTDEQTRRYSDLRVHSFNNSHASTVAPRLINYLRTRRPAILLSMPNILNFPSIVAVHAAKTSTKSVITEHNTLSHDMGVRNFSNCKMRVIPTAMRLLYPHAHGLIAPSNAILTDPLFKAMTRRCHIPTAVIPNPLTQGSRSTLYISNAELLHPWLSPSRDIPVLLSSGRLVDQKGFDTLLQTMWHLKRRSIPARLLVLGEGPLRHELNHLRNRLDLVDTVDFLGFREDAPAILQECDAFVLASRWEGFGLVLTEAMAAGKPVVATRAPGGPSEFLRDRYNALLAPVDRPDLLADALDELLSDPSLSKCLSENSLEDVKRFSPNLIAQEYLDFFYRILRS